MTNPTTISIHHTGHIVAHWPERQVPLSQLPVEERVAVLRLMAERYNAHEGLLERAAATPEEGHL